MRAVILSAGQGSRLLPLTEGRPKCLLPLGPRTLLEWQIWALTQNGIDDIAVVTGYHAPDVASLLNNLAGANLSIRTVYNPFFKLADNLASCWMARVRSSTVSTWATQSSGMEMSKRSSIAMMKFITARESMPRSCTTLVDPCTSTLRLSTCESAAAIS